MTGIIYKDIIYSRTWSFVKSSWKIHNMEQIIQLKKTW